jgi:hypothetical protein
MAIDLTGRLALEKADKAIEIALRGATEEMEVIPQHHVGDDLHPCCPLGTDEPLAQNLVNLRVGAEEEFRVDATARDEVEGIAVQVTNRVAHEEPDGKPLVRPSRIMEATVLNKPF